MLRRPWADRIASLPLRQRLGLALGPAAGAATFVILWKLGLTGKAAGAAATVILMGTWWMSEALPLWVTGLVPLLAFPATGAVPIGQVVLQYFDPVNFLFLGGMWIAAAMEHQGLHRRLALGIVARIGTSPRRIVLGFMLSTCFVSMWISNTAAALMMFPIGMAVLQRFESERGGSDPDLRRFGMGLMLGIGYAASIGGIGTKIGTGTNLVFVKAAGLALGLDVGFLAWMAMGLPIVVIAIPLAWLYLVRVAAKLPAEEFPGGRRAIDDARRALPRMSRGEAAALAGFLIAGGLWVFRETIDLGTFRIIGWSALLPWSWSDIVGRNVNDLPPPLAGLLGPRGAESVVALVVGLGLIALPIGRKPFRTALPPRRALDVSWDLLVLLGGGFAMADGVAQSGLSGLLATALGGFSAPHPFVTLVCVCLVTTALSEIASNTATASILLPLLAASSHNLGVPAPTLMFAATLAASFGFMLPAGTPPNAVVFSSGYIPVGKMAASGLVVDIGGSLLIATLCHFLVPWVLGTP